jgi:hypothetical protein
VKAQGREPPEELERLLVRELALAEPQEGRASPLHPEQRPVQVRPMGQQEGPEPPELLVPSRL